MADVADLAPQALALTTATDAITGGSGADTITGVVSTLTSTKTLSGADVIDGGEGTDTLSVTMTSDFSGFTSDVGSMTNVEVLSATNSSAIARTFNTTGATGLETININANDQSFTVSNLATTGVTVNVANADSTNTITVSYKAASGSIPAANAGTTDELTVGLTDVGTVEDPSTTATEQKAITLTSAGIEVLNVVSNGTANVASLATGDSKNVVVTGAAALKVTAVDTTVTSFDASAATGVMTLDLSGATIATVKTGSAADVITVNALSVDATISGGAGADKLNMKAGGTYQLAMTGVETMNVSGLGSALIMSGLNTADLTTLVIDAAAGAGNSVTIADLEVSAFAINLVDKEDAAAAAGAEAISITSTTDLTVNVSSENDANSGNFTQAITAANATSLALNIGAFTEFDGSVTANAATSAVITVAADGDLTGDVTANGATSVAMTVGARSVTTAGTVTAEDASNVTITTAAALSTDFTFDSATNVSVSSTIAQSALDIDAAEATTLEIDSTKAIVFAGTSDFSAVETVSFSGVGGLDIDAVAIGADAASVTVDASSAKTDAGAGYALELDIDNYAAGSGQASVIGSSLLANKVTIGTGRTEVSVTGGIGADAIVYNTVFGSSTEGVVTVSLGTTGGTDTLTLAAGNLNFSAATLTLTGVDTIIAGDDDTSTLTMNASVLTGKTIAIGNATGAYTDVTLSGTSSADTIDASGITVDTADLTINGAASNDTITGSAGVDIITGGAGADTLKGNGGNDTFIFAAGVTDTVATATSVAGIDKITDFVANAALADLIDLTATVAAVGTAVTGSVSSSTFVADMNTLLAVDNGAGFDTDTAGGISAALITVDAGSLAGKTYLAVDLDASDSFTVADFVIDVTGITATSLTTATFI